MSILDRWRERLDYSNLHGEALRPAFNQPEVLEKWMKRSYGNLDYRLTQLLSGHSCYGNYVYWLGKAATPQCLECRASDDDTDHVLSEYPKFTRERSELVYTLQIQLTLPNIIKAMAEDEKAWAATKRFANSVFS